MTRFTGSNPHEINRRLRREGGFNSEVISGTKTLTWADSQSQSLDPNGSAQDVILPAQPKNGDYFDIHNSGSTDSLTVKNVAGSTVATIGPGEWARIGSPGATWAIGSSSGNTGGEPSTILRVGSGRTYATIGDAAAVAVAGSVIIVDPGAYSETNPVTIPDEVSVTTEGGRESVTVSATVANQHLFVMGTKTSIRGMTLDGVTGSGFAAVHFPAGASLSVLTDIAVDGVPVGIYVEASDKDNRAYGFEYASGTGETAVLVDTGAHFIVFEAEHNGTAILTNFAKADGAGSALHLYTGHLDGDNTDNGIVASDGGLIRAIGCHVHNFDVSLRVGTGAGGTIYAQACDVSSSLTWDLLTETGNGDTVYLGATQIRRDLISLTTGTEMVGSAIDTTPNESGLFVPGSLSQGLPSAPAEANFGEGNSNILDMLVYSFDGTATWADNTADAASPSGSTFAVLQGVTAGNALYLGNTKRKFPGVKSNLTIAQALGAGVGVWEYETSTGWVSFFVMTREDDGGGESYAELTFASTGVTKMAFADIIERVGAGNEWISTTVNGTAGYWVRYRITTGITTAPTCEQFKLITSNVEVDRTGVQRHGRTSDARTFNEGTGATLSVPSGGANAPGTANITISTNVSYQQVNSVFASGTDIKRAGTMIAIPDGVDTSRKAVLHLEWMTDGTSTDAVQWVVYGGQVPSGSTLGALTEQSDAQTDAAPGVANKTRRSEFTFDINELVPGDFISLMIYRLGSTDANTDDATLLSYHFDAYFWR